MSSIKLKNLEKLFRNTRARTVILLTGGILLLAILMGIIRFSKQVDSDDRAAAQIQSLNGIQSVPGGLDKPTSRAYATLQEQHNIQQAEIAARTSRSAVPTIVDTFQIKEGAMQSSNAACIPGNIIASKQSEFSFFYPSELQVGTLVYGPQAKVLGTLSADGKVRDAADVILGQVGPDGLVWDANDIVIGGTGSAIDNLPVYNGAGRWIGNVRSDGTVVETSSNNKTIGVVGIDGIVRDSKGAVIGRVKATEILTDPVIGTPIYDDSQGRLIGIVGEAAQVLDPEGEVIARLNTDKVAINDDGVAIGSIGVTTPGIPVYNAQGQLIGAVGADHIMRGSQGQVLGKLDAEGKVRDKLGAVIGSITPPMLEAASESTAALPHFLEQPRDRSASVWGQDPEVKAILDRQASLLSEQKAEIFTQQRENAMSAQMEQLFSAWRTFPAQQFVAGSLAASDLRATFQSSAPSAAQAAVKAGDIIYAVLLTAVNSDEPGPILAEIIEGKFKGGRLIGTLVNLGERVLLQFNKLNLQSGSKSISVSAIAIDSNTARTALSSVTDRHLLLRYGALFASSFLQGYGQAFQQSGAKLVNSGEGKSTVVYPDLRTEEKLYVALGNVGTQLSSTLQTKIDTPPTIHVHSGTAVGILFTEDLMTLSQ